MLAAVPAPVPARVIHDEVSRLGVTHVLTVPDKHLRTLVASLSADPRLRVIGLSTEDEAVAANAGLWIGGAEPLVVIQSVGVLAAMKALRGVALEQRVPTCMIVGEFGRKPGVPVAENKSSAVRLLGPVLAAMDIPSYRLDAADQVTVLGAAFEQSRRERRSVAVIVGAPTE
jgi:sulfopyruvate decarboxylase TPP-binding subunit